VPIYETLPGIEPGLSEIRSFEQLPPNAARFVSYIESYVGAPITIVGVGPGREQSLIRPTLA
jgi:adenylosuccinate synthase